MARFLPSSPYALTRARGPSSMFSIFLPCLLIFHVHAMLIRRRIHDRPAMRGHPWQAIHGSPSRDSPSHDSLSKIGYP